MTAAPLDSVPGAGDTRLVPAYTFEEFVVGPHNRFPQAASLAVAENLGKAYNPLFLYGPVGIGKTHLMQAVGHRVLQRDPKTRVLYVTAQQFMTEVIELLQAGQLQNLRGRYRALDLLLVDDIQFLATSEATQEEFFHMFNDLHAGGKQIIMTSDRPPKMLTTLEDRLRSRFEWGLIADIKFTNLETRVAILKKKETHLKGLHLADDIRLYIASRLKSNIRELEGFLRRIQAYTQLNNQDISLPLVKEILKELLPPEEWDTDNEPSPAAGEVAPPPAPAPAPAETHHKEASAPPEPTVMEPVEAPPIALTPEAPPVPQSPPLPEPQQVVEEPVTPEPIAASPEEPPVLADLPPGSPKPPPLPSPVEKTDVSDDIKNSLSDLGDALKSMEETAPSPIPEIPSAPVRKETKPGPPVRPGPPLGQESRSFSVSEPQKPAAPGPTPLPGLPKGITSTPLPTPPGTLGRPLPPQAANPLPLQQMVAPASQFVKAGGGQPIGIPGAPGQIPVVFFYPAGHDKELVQMKKKFEDIIKKHKLKFVLHPALEVDYNPDRAMVDNVFVEKCHQAGVSIGVVLGPSPDSGLQESMFFTRLQESFEQAQISLQMVPWDELSKDYRFLNLALDITLIRIKQR